jgi:hypothetical protein
MISVITVYNDRKKLDRCLRAGLRSQQARFELVEVDNMDGRFAGAAAALNWGFGQAGGDVVCFVHQDVVFLQPDWLSRCEEIVNGHPQGGWFGVCGVTRDGKLRGLLKDRTAVVGAPLREPAQVQSLDEVVLIHRREGAGFDEKLCGWHSYGTDACLSDAILGRPSYVLPLPIWHDSPATNQRGLAEAQQFLREKYARHFKTIHTTCGTVGDSQTPAGRLALRVFGRLAPPVLRLLRWEHLFVNTVYEAIERVTSSVASALCLHAAAPIPALEAEAFSPEAAQQRCLRHTFVAPQELSIGPDETVVLMPDFCAGPDRDALIGALSRRPGRTFAAIEPSSIWTPFRAWSPLFRSARRRHVAFSWVTRKPIVIILEWSN